MDPDRGFSQLVSIVILTLGVLGVMLLPLFVILLLSQVMRRLHRASTRSRRASR